MSALTFPFILSAAGLSAPSLPSPATASPNSLPDLVTPDNSEPAASPHSLAVLTLSDTESNNRVYSLRAHSWAASEWREDEQQGRFDPVIVNVITTISDDSPIALHPVSSPNTAPDTPPTASTFRAKKPFCVRCHKPGHIVRDCRRQRRRTTQKARCSGGLPPAPAQPTIHWDTHHEAWSPAPPVDQRLDPTANAFWAHRQHLLNRLRDANAGIDKLKEHRMYWSDQLWAMGWQEPPHPSKEQIRTSQHTWADEEDHPRHPSWGLPGRDY
ncbi:hypothetical protein EWM64_g4724 [Hericium alpestre]|uniref:CCHC-type domain-containing protein n=1 Tax=Hericium alpestre TaxID=135208 RepID=A0A4Y9ZWM2_9AGAM|nr:hypothetical protein EWM64_g4724 [Hericium alpestre]